uniref:Uncharacterized protein n=1 Tax=uncultured bacterium contig00081 TaxID=1181557 RepID=A0A806K0K6_9BACT|nr:hypothetical protein [uncultured bacterium contig00081]
MKESKTKPGNKGTRKRNGDGKETLKGLWLPAYATKLSSNRQFQQNYYRLFCQI